jgi:hypothetical protein
MVFLTVQEAAEAADVKPALLKLWLQTGKFKIASSGTSVMGGKFYFFTEPDIVRLMKFVKSEPKQKAIKEKEPSDKHLTPARLAKEWDISAEKIRDIFRNEPDVIKIGKPATRHRRAYVTLRIPKEVAVRVRRRLSE